MYTDSLTTHFRKFLKERLTIASDRLAKELVYDRANLQKIIIGKRNIPKAKRGDFITIMKKYGYSVQD